MIIKVKQTRYEKKQGTKTVYIPASVKEFDYTEQNYDWFIDASNGFRRAGGGSETNIKGYTLAGYKVIRNISVNPSKTVKIVTEFDFNNGGRKNG